MNPAPFVLPEHLIAGEMGGMNPALPKAIAFEREKKLKEYGSGLVTLNI
jgi:hypothetical protein